MALALTAVYTENQTYKRPIVVVGLQLKNDLSSSMSVLSSSVDPLGTVAECNNGASSSSTLSWWKLQFPVSSSDILHANNARKRVQETFSF